MAVIQRVLAACLLLGLGSSAIAQDKPASASAELVQPRAAAKDLEPAVDTSAPHEDAQAKPAAAAKAAPANPAARIKSKAKDRIELDTTQITGNRELPKVMYIVPWKRSDLSDLDGRPVNSLLDEVLMPVDRDVFKRENRYYGALKPDAAQPAAAPPARDEK